MKEKPIPQTFWAWVSGQGAAFPFNPMRLRSGERVWWWTQKRGVLQSMGSQRVGHNWAADIKTNIKTAYPPTQGPSTFCSLTSQPSTLGELCFQRASSTPSCPGPLLLNACDLKLDSSKTSITNSWSLLRLDGHTDGLTSIESVMPSNHLILCRFDVNVAANTDKCLCFLFQRAESSTLDTDPLILSAFSRSFVCYSDFFGKKMINTWHAFLVVSFECFGFFF